MGKNTGDGHRNGQMKDRKQFITQRLVNIINYYRNW